ncbi:MAG TPA: nicotinamide-nucleotide amidohydrolase family protein [Burkholderiales bacterium]|jgi:nicotinamide-nucleotide amidase|nr:nicotinamide-nucleotide amidohydrolase family protein [Burkholderiales bacterium]
MDAELYEIAGRVGDALKARGHSMAAAESCTGGWIGQAVTMVPGSSKWFERGFVTYTNEAKQEMLGVAAETLKKNGAVSEPVVREMAQGALKASRAQVAVAVSGVAGPDGGTPKKPVGTVCIAWCRGGEAPLARSFRFMGDRDSVRRQSVIAALEGLVALVNGGQP